jgi:hypothetical protein
MGVINQGILGSVSGRIGPVVGGSWKGIAYLRGYQANVAQPNTAAQVAQKLRMSTIVATAKQFLAIVIKPLNDRFAVRMSGYNLFVSRNIEHISGAGVVDFPSLVFSEGTLTGFDTLAGTSVGGSADVDFTWVDNSGTGTAQATDEVYAALINATSGETAQDGGSAVRSDAALTVTFDANNTTADEIETYLAFRTSSGFAVSNSEYNQVVSS